MVKSVSRPNQKMNCFFLGDSNPNALIGKSCSCVHSLLEAMSREADGVKTRTTQTQALSVLQVVLAGDPLQLGAVLRSDLAKLYGLDYSLLERLIFSELYARDEQRFADHGSYDPLLVSRAPNVRNLRWNLESHGRQMRRNISFVNIQCQ